MRRAFRLASTAALAGLLAGTAAWAAVEPAEPRIISVSGEGEVRAVPDEVSLVLRVASEDPKPSEARRLMAETAAAVLAALRKANIPAKDIQTSQANLSAQYRFDRGNRTLAGYRAETAVRVKLSKLGTYDEIVEKALAAGASELAGVDFSHSRFRELAKEARKKAVEDALEKAKLLASAANARIGRIHRISEEGSPPPFRALRAMGASEEGPAPSIAEGEIVVRVTIQASWEILD